MLTSVTGINWGDEGKGRIVDLLTEKADYVVRYQGGNNAGHTVVTDQGKFVLNLLPSGILHPTAVCVLGNGMVIDPDHLRHEIAMMQYMKVKVDASNLKISDKATICMPFHVRQDVLEEERLSKTGSAFGSTRRGIAYAYGDKYMKKTLRMGDLLELDAPSVQHRLKVIIDSKNLVLENVYNQGQKSCGFFGKRLRRLHRKSFVRQWRTKFTFGDERYFCRERGLPAKMDLHRFAPAGANSTRF